MTNQLIKPKNRTFLISALFVVIASTTSVYAFQGEVGSGFDAPFEKQFTGKHKRHHHKMMVRYLELTDEQQAEMKSIRQQAKTEGSAIKESLSTYKEKVSVIIQADEFDQAAFENLHAEYQQNFSQMALLKAKTKHAMRQVLTEEQQEKWAEIKPKRGRR